MAKLANGQRVGKAEGRRPWPTAVARMRVRRPGAGDGAVRATNGSEITRTDARAHARARERVGESEGRRRWPTAVARMRVRRPGARDGAVRATNGSEITRTDASAHARARERVGESEGRCPSDKKCRYW